MDLAIIAVDKSMPSDISIQQIRKRITHYLSSQTKWDSLATAISWNDAQRLRVPGKTRSNARKDADLYLNGNIVCAFLQNIAHFAADVGRTVVFVDPLVWASPLNQRPDHLKRTLDKASGSDRSDLWSCCISSYSARRFNRRCHTMPLSQLSPGTLDRGRRVPRPEDSRVLRLG